jgi:branched-chain amino acid transport system ATP-binding protein
MLEVEGVSAAYGNLDVLHDVALTVKEHEFIGLLGSNNAGKTTLINCLSGIVPTRAG